MAFVFELEPVCFSQILVRLVSPTKSVVELRHENQTLVRVIIMEETKEQSSNPLGDHSSDLLSYYEIKINFKKGDEETATESRIDELKPHASSNEMEQKEERKQTDEEAKKQSINPLGNRYLDPLWCYETGVKSEEDEAAATKLRIDELKSHASDSPIRNNSSNLILCQETEMDIEAAPVKRLKYRTDARVGTRVKSRKRTRKYTVRKRVRKTETNLRPEVNATGAPGLEPGPEPKRPDTDCGAMEIDEIDREECLPTLGEILSLCTICLRPVTEQKDLQCDQCKTALLIDDQEVSAADISPLEHLESLLSGDDISQCLSACMWEGDDILMDSEMLLNRD